MVAFKEFLYQIFLILRTLSNNSVRPLSSNCTEEEEPRRLINPALTLTTSRPEVPKVSAICLVVLLPMLVITITEATPIITPSRERKVRVLLLLKFLNAFIKSSNILSFHYLPIQNADAALCRLSYAGVVRYNDYSCIVLAVDFAEHLHNLLSGFCVEGTGRLVG